MRKIVLLLALLYAQSAFTQTKSDVFNGNVELTWLGLDFTHVNFIGNAAQWQDAGDISITTLRDKYFVGWNELFINESEKYNVAEATKRTKVKYKIDVTATPNSKSDRDYFVNDPGEFRHLDRSEVDKIISKYDFKGNSGIGMMFVVEGMHKEAKKSSMWCVFVSMSSKEILLAKRIEGKAGGFGFRNYWAKSFYNGLQEVEDNLKKWKK